MEGPPPLSHIYGSRFRYIAVISILIYKGLCKELGDFEVSGPAMVSLGCAAEVSFLAEVMTHGTLLCTSEYLEHH
jgi:hypothetical protein